MTQIVVARHVWTSASPLAVGCASPRENSDPSQVAVDHCDALPAAILLRLLSSLRCELACSDPFQVAAHHSVRTSDPFQVAAHDCDLRFLCSSSKKKKPKKLST